MVSGLHIPRNKPRFSPSTLTRGKNICSNNGICGRWVGFSSEKRILFIVEATTKTHYIYIHRNEENKRNSSFINIYIMRNMQNPMLNFKNENEIYIIMFPAFKMSFHQVLSIYVWDIELSPGESWNRPTCHKFHCLNKCFSTRWSRGWETGLVPEEVQPRNHLKSKASSA